MFDLDTHILAPGENWIRMLVGASWINPVILGAVNGPRNSAITMPTMLFQGWQFY